MRKGSRALTRAAFQEALHQAPIALAGRCEPVNEVADILKAAESRQRLPLAIRGTDWLLAAIRPLGRGNGSAGLLPCAAGSETVAIRAT
eukprot:scaffold1616_cov310-Pinguiococcus_pyrenoidosus.AAC.8